MNHREEHRVFDGVEHKWCGRCMQWLPLECFGKNLARWDGLYNACRECQNKYFREAARKARAMKQYNEYLRITTTKQLEAMTNEEKREQTIQGLANMLRMTPFQVEFKVKKKPQGIKVIIEVTQEQLDGAMDDAAKNRKEG